MTPRRAARTGGSAPWRPERRPARRWPAAALLVCLGGCVNTLVDDGPGSDLVPAIDQRAVVIPLGEAGEGAPDAVLLQFYEGILVRLRDAHVARDLATMRDLLARYHRDDLPDWARHRLDRFAGLCAGLAIELHLSRNARLEPLPAAPGPDPAADPAVPEEIGAVCRYELVVPPMPGAEILFGARADADPIAFGVDVRVRDHFLDGSSRRYADGGVVHLADSFRLATAPLRLPVELDLGASRAVQRDLELRVDLMPGYLHVVEAQGRKRAPVRRTPLSSASLTQWPPGFRAIREEPLETLRQAMALGDPAHFAHVRLAAVFASPADRPAIEAALIDWVRLGRPDQALVAMATLTAIGAAEVPTGDRDAWLAWWQSRR